MKRIKKMKLNVSLPRLSADETFKNKLSVATRFFLDELNVSVRMQNTLNVKINVRKTVLKRYTYGTCTIKANGSQSTKDYTIILSDNFNEFDQLLTLAHECVHIEQQVTKRLQIRKWSSDKKVHAIWNNVEMGEYLVDVPYEEAGWEIEAREKEDALVRKFYSKVIQRQGSWLEHFGVNK